MTKAFASAADLAEKQISYHGNRKRAVGVHCRRRSE